MILNLNLCDVFDFVFVIYEFVLFACVFVLLFLTCLVFFYLVSMSCFSLLCFVYFHRVAIKKNK